MDFISTRFISYHEIKVEKIDLYEDAFGLYPEINDMIDLPPGSEFFPAPGLVEKLLRKIRKTD